MSANLFFLQKKHVKHVLNIRFRDCYNWAYTIAIKSHNVGAQEAYPIDMPNRSFAYLSCTCPISLGA